MAERRLRPCAWLAAGCVTLAAAGLFARGPRPTPTVAALTTPPTERVTAEDGGRTVTAATQASSIWNGGRLTPTPPPPPLPSYRPGGRGNDRGPGGLLPYIPPKPIFVPGHPYDRTPPPRPLPPGPPPRRR